MLMVEVDDLSKTYNYKPVFQAVNYQLFAGKACHLVGRNGVGKTTFLKILAGLYSYQGYYKAHVDIAYLGHKSGLYGPLTPWQNLYYLKAWVARGIKVEQAIEQLVKLEVPVHLPIDKLSAGQQQIVAIVSLIALNKQCWLLDESMQCLDIAAAKYWFEVCDQHVKNGGSIIFTSHLQHDLLLSIATDVLKLQAVK